MAASLTQIIYKEEQRAECYPFANVYFNDKLTIFFENEVILKLVPWTTVDKIGVCSWKLKQKQRWNVGRPREITKELLESDYEVLSFTKNTHWHQMMAASERWHPGFRLAMHSMCDGLGIQVPTEVKQPVYQNAFMARYDIYMEYLTNYLVPVIDRITYDPAVLMEVSKDSRYHELAKTDAAPREWLQKQIGMPFYPLCPFLLERLFPIFCHNKKINVSYI